MLLFKKKFLPAIRSGEKTQTIRLWKHRKMKPGQRSYIPGAGYIRVLSVDEVQLAELTDADAQPDGFATADLLRSEIETLYPGEVQSGRKKAFRIVFCIVPKDKAGDVDLVSQQAAVHERRPRKPRC